MWYIQVNTKHARCPVSFPSISNWLLNYHKHTHTLETAFTCMLLPTKSAWIISLYCSNSYSRRCCDSASTCCSLPVINNTCTLILSGQNFWLPNDSLITDLTLVALTLPCTHITTSGDAVTETKWWIIAICFNRIGYGGQGLATVRVSCD